MSRFSPQSLTPKNSISIYTGDLSTKTIIKTNKIISDCFPDLEQGFYNQFNRLIKNDGFSDQRLIDAVDHVIKTCIYPRPTIAQFLSYDHRIDLHSYQNIKKMCNTNYNAFEEYQYVESLKKYAHKSDIKKWNLE